MQVTKEYKRGGFFGNSQAKFSDMEGAGKGINMAYANRGLLKTKGAALRREKRHLKKLEREGKLNEYGTQSADRLDYLRNVQKDRAKKGIAAGALAAGAAFGAPALVGAVKGAGGLAGIAGKLGGKSLFKGATKAIGNIQKGKELFDALTPEQEAQIDSGDFGQPDMFGKYGMRILKEGGLVGGQKRLDKNNDGKLTREDFEMLRAMLGARLPR